MTMLRDTCMPWIEDSVEDKMVDAVFSIYFTDSRGNSMRYATETTRSRANDRVESLAPLFPSLKAIEIREEEREAI
jgi:hypothetical protein